MSLRVCVAWALGLLFATAQAGSREADGHDGTEGPEIWVVDVDDDDDNGVIDGQQARLGSQTLQALRWLSKAQLAPGARAPSGAPFRLVNQKGVPFEPGDALSGARVGLQGLFPGLGRLPMARGDRTFAIVEMRALDAKGRSVDMAKSHASLSRELPTELAPPHPDEDALRWLVIGPSGHLPPQLWIVSSSATDKPMDRTGPLALLPTECPPGTSTELRCAVSTPVRASTDPVDRHHPAAAHRSVLAEVGGRLRAELAPGVGVSLRVGGPRAAQGYEVGRYRARVRTHVLRTGPQSPAVGANDREARQIVRQELATASALWGQCGIHFGPPDDMEVHVVDVPPPHLLAVGCDEGQPASGGIVQALVGGTRIRLETRAGETPAEVAVRWARAIERAGFSARVSLNALAQRAASRTADLLVRDGKGGFVPLAAPEDGPLSTDTSLPVCLGEVDLGDGLRHFTDFDAAAGTVEERALVKAFEDDDPSTIELFVIPSFGGTGRIGESFIFAPGGSMQNAVILDRAGIRSGARSFTLAHELGHVLLEMPGHPDDFGVDTPSSLMDADASDPSIFGPRRLSIADCERALRQSGPKAPVPLLQPWPLFESPPGPHGGAAPVGQGSGRSAR